MRRRGALPAISTLTSFGDRRLGINREKGQFGQFASVCSSCEGIACAIASGLVSRLGAAGVSRRGSDSWNGFLERIH